MGAKGIECKKMAKTLLPSSAELSLECSEKRKGMGLQGSH
jgi:hypothetical protein